MRKPLRHLWIAWALLVPTLPVILPAEEPKAGADDLNQRLTDACRRDTAEYSLSLGSGASSRPAKSLEVLKWVNPVRSDQLGVVHAWLHNGRVAAISSVFSSRPQTDQVRFTHEFVSLATEPLIGTFGGMKVWQPAQAGVTFQKFPEAPAPTESRPARLRQMRTLVRNFTAHSVSPYQENARWELRMLPQPLLRYESREDGQVNDDVLDGALFCFVSNAGTDPEILLPVEARRAGNGWEWQYAAGRFSDHSLYLQLGERTVWQFDNRGGNVEYAAGQTDIYRFRFGRSLPLTELE
jgi:hypothetical protein